MLDIFGPAAGVLPPTVVGMRHDNDAVPTVRTKAAGFLRNHLSSPRRAVAYGLLAAVSTGALAMAARPDTADAATPATAKTAATAKSTRSAEPAAARSSHRAASKELRVKYQAQPNYYWCGPAATRNALTATGHNVTMAKLAHTMGTTEAGTNSAHDITAALNKVTGGHKYHTTELAQPAVSPKQANALQRDIVTTIDDHRAVVANVAGTATDTKGKSHSYEGGHYIAVHGYRDHGRQVEIADSANPKTAHYWIDTTDLADWMATRGYSH
jgi:hypothetical protein